jgi:hypothetical protein
MVEEVSMPGEVFNLAHLAQRVLQDAPVVILVLDLEGRIEHVNPFFERLTGYRLDEVRGRDWFDTLLPERDRERIRALFGGSRGGEHVCGHVNPIVTRTGEERQIEWTDEFLRDNEGRATGILAIGQDVTERKQAEEQLREFKATLDQTRDCVFIFAPDSLRFTYANQGATAQVGYTAAELSRMTPLDIKPEFDEPRFRAMIAPLMKGERLSLMFETLHRHKDGTTLPVEIILQYVAPADQSARFVAIVRDISERKKLERRLQESEARYALVERAVNEGIWDWDLHSNNGFLSPQWKAILGYRDDELPNVTSTFFDLVHPDDRGAVNAAMKRHLHDGARYDVELRLRHKDGTYRWVRSRGEAVRDATGRAVRMVGTIADITDRLAAEKKIAEQSRLLELIFQYSLDNIVILDKDYNIIRVSDSYARSCQVDAADLIGRNHFEVFPSHFEHELAPYRQAKRTYRRTERPFVFLDHPERGTTYWDIAVVPILDAAHQIEFHLFTLKDVSDRKRAEERTAKSEERLRLALDASGQATWELDLETMTVRYSPEHAQMLGFNAEELSGQDRDAFQESIHPADRERVFAAFRASLAGETAKYQAEFRLRTKSGTWKWIFANGKVVERAADGRPLRMIGTHTDIDDRKDAELQIASSLREKETLLREIHHRVKNNLQVIAGLLYFQTKKLRAPEDVAAFAELRQRIFAMALVHERLYQSRDVARIDFGDYVRDLVAELGGSFEPRKGIRIEVTTDEVRLPIELALPSGMIVCELVTNVFKYAFPGMREGAATVSVRMVGARVVLTVDDDGVGFPEGFGPGAGGSFGWELVRMLVLQLDGTVEARTDQGAHVRVSFPAPAATEEVRS